MGEAAFASPEGLSARLNHRRVEQLTSVLHYVIDSGFNTASLPIRAVGRDRLDHIGNCEDSGLKDYVAIVQSSRIT